MQMHLGRRVPSAQHSLRPRRCGQRPLHARIAAPGIAPAGSCLWRSAPSTSLLTAAIANNTVSPPPPLDRQPELRLREWVLVHGGYIHPDIQLVDDTPSGCRGVVACKDIPLHHRRSAGVVSRPNHRDVLARAPAGTLIVVPQCLYMTAAAARQQLDAAAAATPRSAVGWLAAGLRRVASPAPAPAAKALPASMQLALLLAAERAKGADSFWAPYIELLPQEPPCGWAQPEPQLRQALASLGPWAEGWLPEVRRARLAVEQRCQHAVQLYGKRLDGAMQPEDAVWALGQVLSRSFGQEPDVGLAPYIDLLNHRTGAPRPVGLPTEGEDDGTVVTDSNEGEEEEENVVAGEAYAVVSSLYGVPLPLSAGDEVCISYVSGSSALQAFLNLGFVPPELVRQGGGDGGAAPAAV